MHWLPQNLDEHLKPLNTRGDLSKVMTIGESAGGWCSVQTALLHGTGLAGFPSSSSPVKIVAAVSCYGVLDLKVCYPLTPKSRLTRLP